VTWRPSVQVREEKGEGAQRVKVVTGAVSLVPKDKLDENTAAVVAAVSHSSTRALSVRMHDKLAALVALGKHLGMFDKRTQKTNMVYVISDRPMSAEEWSSRHVTPSGTPKTLLSAVKSPYVHWPCRVDGTVH
jgi:hypothetical protein